MDFRKLIHLVQLKLLTWRYISWEMFCVKRFDSEKNRFYILYVKKYCKRAPLNVILCAKLLAISKASNKSENKKKESVINHLCEIGVEEIYIDAKTTVSLSRHSYVEGCFDLFISTRISSTCQTSAGNLHE